MKHAMKQPKFSWILFLILAVASAGFDPLAVASPTAGPVATAGAGVPAAPSGWIATVTQDVQRSEYRFSLLPDGSFAAPNRAQNLRAHLAAEGLTLGPRVGPDEAPPFMLGLRLVGYGRDGALLEPAAAMPRLEGDRVEYWREGFDEWYANDERGIEQGFTLRRSPQEASTEVPVVIEMAVQGDALGFPSEDGLAVMFRTDSGAAALLYSDLRATDARGDQVPARLAFASGRLRIEIDDREALYPITVDPLMTSPAWTAESDQDHAQFGTSVATAGDVNGDGFSDVIVGAPFYDNGEPDEGRVFVYLGSASGLATAPAWAAESDQAGAQFGTSVATAGDVNGDGFSDVIVGAPFYDNGQPDEGRVFVYLGSASGLATAPAWTAESDQDYAQFGNSVATAGDIDGDGNSDVIVGAYLYDNYELNEGRAYVYLGSASGLATTPSWTAESDQAGAKFGYSVATAGDVNGDGFSDVIVGAPFYDNGHPTEGRVFVYLGSASGLTTAPAWTAESGIFGNKELGYSVSTAGDVNGDGYADVIVGAPVYSNGQGAEGRALVYLGSATGLATTPAWTAESNLNDARFGSSVATAGDINGDGYSDVIVGAYHDASLMNRGRAYVYLGLATGLATSPAWTVESDQPFTNFGYSVATAGDVNGDGYSDVVVGVPLYDNGQTDEGRVYVYLGSGDGLKTTAGWTTESNQTDAYLGLSVATAGDVNGDGYSDLIVSAPNYDSGQTDEGKVFLYMGSASGPASTPAWTAESNQDYAYLGSGQVGAAGDVNGDGYSDVIVGTPAYDHGQTDEGAAFVWYGSASGLGPNGTPANAGWMAESNQTSAYLGYGVSAGDVNGDGYGDIIIGAPSYDNGQTDEGAAFVWYGSASGLGPNGTPANADWMAESDQAGAQFAFPSTTGNGDVNGDGYSDVIVGANLYDNGQTDEGAAFVWYGSASGLGPNGTPANADWMAESDQSGSDFGIYVDTAGDVNGDGYSDVIVGADYYSNGEPYEGAAFVWYGGASGLGPNGTPANADWTAESNQSDAYLGLGVASAGDVNGDGYSDIIVGTPDYFNGLIADGAAFVWYGSASGLGPNGTPANAGWTAEGNQDNAFFGDWVATAGDVNGDGFGDVIVGAYRSANDQVNEGRAYVYYGGGGGLDRAAQQIRADGAAPIGLLGKSDSEAAFRLRALGRTASGRGRVKLEWEVKPLGAPFSGTGLGRGASFADTGFPGLSTGSSVGLEERVTGLAASTTQHWRARIVSRDPFFQRSPWLSPAGNNRTETDFKTPASAPPFVVDVTPPNLSEGQSQAASVVLTFSEAVDAATITSSTFRLKDPGGSPVAATVSLSSSGRQAVLDPASALPAETLYTVDVTSSVHDLAGNPATPFTSSFRTEAAPSPGGTPLPSVSDPSTPPPSPTNARLGSSVSAAGDLNGDGVADFISGSPGYVVGGNTEAGAAVVYLGSTVTSQRQAPDIIFRGAAAHDRAGVSVSGDFDFNGDGIPDLLIGAEQVNRTGGTPTAVGAGKVYLIFFDPTDTTHYPNFDADGTADAVSLSLVGQPGGIPGVVFTGVSVGDQVGFSVAGRGTPPDPIIPPDPIVPNSYAAILIGAPGRTPPNPIRTSAGTVYQVYPPNPIISGTVSLGRVANGQGDQVPGIVYQGAEADDHLGFAVTFPGDVMGSPGEDMAFSSPYADTVVDSVSHADAGKVYVAQGGSAVTAILEADAIGNTIAGTQFLGEQTGALLGYSIAGGGDSRVDGTADFLMGAPLYDVTVSGFSAGSSSDSGSSGRPSAGFANSAGASAGSTSRSPATDSTLTDAGSTYTTSSRLPGGIIEVCRVGSLSEPDALAGVVWLGGAAGDQLGIAVAGVGDVNGDGLADIALGAPLSDPNGTTDAGATYLIDGAVPSTEFGGMVSVSTVGTTTAGTTLVGTQAGEQSGSSLAGTGDINAGGTADMAVGAPNRDVNTTGDDAGTVYQVVLDDADGDGLRDGEDCAKNDPSLWAIPGEVWNETLSHNKQSGVTTITWSEPLERGGIPASLQYDTLRSPPGGPSFTSQAVCLETGGTDRTSTDSATPPAGKLYYYLVRAKNLCGTGTAGNASSGVPRQTRSCP